MRRARKRLITHRAEDHPRGHYIVPHAHRRGQLVFARSGVMQVETAAGFWIVPPQRAVNAKGLFGREAFTYDAADDSFICPAGERLRLKQRCKTDRLDKYMARDCRQCPLKSRCTTPRRRDPKARGDKRSAPPEERSA